MELVENKCCSIFEKKGGNVKCDGVGVKCATYDEQGVIDYLNKFQGKQWK